MTIDEPPIAYFISNEALMNSAMFAEYIQAALVRAEYKIIDNGEEPYFVDVPELDGVWAIGRTVEDACSNFIEALEDWIAAHLLWNPGSSANWRSYQILAEILRKTRISREEWFSVS
jgi:predicted RNase H-like HicB family nuclease